MILNFPNSRNTKQIKENAASQHIANKYTFYHNKWMSQNLIADASLKYILQLNNLHILINLK